jgi:hypothetical protein
MRERGSLTRSQAQMGIWKGSRKGKIECTNFIDMVKGYPSIPQYKFLDINLCMRVELPPSPRGARLQVVQV